MKLPMTGEQGLHAPSASDSSDATSVSESSYDTLSITEDAPRRREFKTRRRISRPRSPTRDERELMYQFRARPVPQSHYKRTPPKDAPQGRARPTNRPPSSTEDEDEAAFRFRALPVPGSHYRRPRTPESIRTVTTPVMPHLATSERIHQRKWVSALRQLQDELRAYSEQVGDGEDPTEGQDPELGNPEERLREMKDLEERIRELEWLAALAYFEWMVECDGSEDGKEPTKDPDADEEEYDSLRNELQDLVTSHRNELGQLTKKLIELEVRMLDEVEDIQRNVGDSE